MKKLVFDIEADGLNPTKIWCIVAKDLDEGTCRTFNPNQLLDGVEYLQSADVLIGHNIIGYDIPAIEKIMDVKLNAKVVDTLVMSRLFQPVRENGHSLKTWGYRINFHKQEQPDDYVICSGMTHSVREFCDLAFSQLGLSYEDHVVVDEQFFRPAEVDLLVGDYGKAKRVLAWEPSTSFKDLVAMMVEADLALLEGRLKGLA